MTGSTSTQAVLSPLTAEHVSAVLEIERASAHSHPWTEGIFESELAQTDSRSYLVAVVDGAVVGFGGVIVQVGEGTIANIAVSPSHRRQGIAEVVLEELLAIARVRGAAAVTLEVRVSNVAAQGLYAKFGFSSSGVRPGYYPDKEDAMIMWLTGGTHG